MKDEVTKYWWVLVYCLHTALVQWPLMALCPYSDYNYNPASTTCEEAFVLAVIGEFCTIFEWAMNEHHTGAVRLHQGYILIAKKNCSRRRDLL